MSEQIREASYHSTGTIDRRGELDPRLRIELHLTLLAERLPSGADCGILDECRDGDAHG